MPRPKGSMNKNSAFVKNQMKKIMGDDFDPFIMACESLKAVHESAQVENTAESHVAVIDNAMKVMPYIAPKLAAQTIEINDDTSAKTYEELEQRARELETALGIRRDAGGDETGTEPHTTH